MEHIRVKWWSRASAVEAATNVVKEGTVSHIKFRLAIHAATLLLLNSGMHEAYG